MRFFTVILITLSLMLIACSNSTNVVDDSSPNADITFSIVDEQGKDRLNPSHNSPLNESNLEIYYLKDGKKERVFEGNLDYPKNFKIYYSEGRDQYVMMLWLSNYIEEDGYTTTFIKFPDGTMGMLKMKPLREEGSAVEKLWYDGELVYTVENPKFFEITKAIESNNK